MRTSSPSAKFPRIRRAFGGIEEIATVINRSRTYTHQRLVGHGEFTRREKLMILAHLGEGQERMRDYFPEEVT